MQDSFGVPYQGSKRRLAPDIIAVLPSGDVFVDVFAGGCAVTHAALLSGKWDCYIANDIGMGPQLFLDAVTGRYKYEARFISRDEFQALKETDPWVRYCWSFGNNGGNYMYAVELEPWKQALHYAGFFRDMGPFRAMGISDLPAPPERLTPWGRVLWLAKRINARHLRIYRDWFARERLELKGEDLENAINATEADVAANAEELRAYLCAALDAAGLTRKDVDRHLGTNGMAGHYFGRSQWAFPTPDAYAKMQEILPALDRPYSTCGAYLQRLQSLQSLQRLETARLDYRALEVPAGAIIYCDPPYKGTQEYAGAEGFDHGAFYDWTAAQARRGCRVYISEYDMPADRFRCIWKRPVRALMSQTNTGVAIEKLFIPKP